MLAGKYSVINDNTAERLLLIQRYLVKRIYDHIYKRTDKSYALSLLKVMKLTIQTKPQKTG